MTGVEDSRFLEMPQRRLDSEDWKRGVAASRTGACTPALSRCGRTVIYFGSRNRQLVLGLGFRKSAPPINTVVTDVK